MFTLAVAAILWAPLFLATLRHARSLGAAAPVAFILIHIFGVVAFVPATVFAVAGGALFGFTQGVVYSLIGGSFGAVGAFLIGRYVARRFVARRLAASPQAAAIDRAISSDGGRILFLLRLSPVMPFNVLNYMLGASSVRLKDFVIASAGMLPGTMVGAYAGQVAGDALALAGETHPVWNSSYYLALVAGLAATVLAAAAVGRAARRALRNVA
jgi:uncharacterized membrane protein YdjX (TVP38/TMEM64 family)